MARPETPLLVYMARWEHLLPETFPPEGRMRSRGRMEKEICGFLGENRIHFIHLPSFSTISGNLISLQVNGHGWEGPMHRLRRRAEGSLSARNPAFTGCSERLPPVMCRGAVNPLSPGWTKPEISGSSAGTALTPPAASDTLTIFGSSALHLINGHGWAAPTRSALPAALCPACMDSG